MAVDRHKVADGNNNFLDLLGQFAGGSEDEGLAGLDVGIDFLKNGDREGGSLARSRLGLGNNVGPYVPNSVFTMAAYVSQESKPLMTGMMARC